MLKLDFSIVTSDERNAFVNEFFTNNPLYVPNQHELDTISNYILYGKEPIDKHGVPTDDPSKWTNMTTRHEIEITTKHNTWKRAEPSSLDEMYESPTFNEGCLLSPKVHVKAHKPVFDRARENDLPSIHELWTVIDYYSEKLKKEDLTAAQRYQMRHMLIELRREQFTLRDIFKPAYQHSASANRSIYIPRECENELDWESADSPCGFAPMGLYHQGDKRFTDPLALTNEKDDWGYNLGAKTIIDFRNPDHIGEIVLHYLEIETFCADNFVSSQKAILNTLDFYIDNTKLTGAQLAILRYKIARLPNKDIAVRVNSEYNKTYNINYISTIYRKICASIAQTSERIFNYYYERINPYSFKKCSACGVVKLRNSDEFMRKSRNSDGFSTKCKECEHNGKRK